MKFNLLQRAVLSILAFIAVCGMSLFSAAAGGVEWGKPDAGALAFMTMIAASGAALLAFLSSGDNWE